MSETKGPSPSTSKDKYVKKDRQIDLEPYIPYSKNAKTFVELEEKPSLVQFVQSNQILEPTLFKFYKSQLTTKIVAVDRICHTLKSGKVYLFRTVVVTGNKKGIVGVGVGKSISKVDSVKKAELDSKKELVYMRRLEQDGFFCPVKKSSHKYGSTKVTVCPLTGRSVTSSKKGKVYCELGGLVNIKIYVGTKKRDKKGKVKSPLNYFKALHEAVKKQLVDNKF